MSWDFGALFAFVLHHSLPAPIFSSFPGQQEHAWFERGFQVIKNDIFFLGKSASYPFLRVFLIDLVEGCKSLGQGKSQSPPSLGNSLVQQPGRELSWEQSEEKGVRKTP